jgi:hypothetical protein
MKRILIELGAHLGVLLALVLVIGVGALFFGATTGAMAAAIAPDFHIQVAVALGLVCPKGDTVNFRHDRVTTTTDSFGHSIAGTANDVTCVSPVEGTSHLLTPVEYLNAKLQAIGVAMAGYSLLCFVPLFLPLEIVALILVHKVVGGMMKPAPASQTVISN